MRELQRVLFHRAALFLLLLLTAIGAVLFWLHTKDSVVAKDYPVVFTSVYHGLLEEYKDIPPEEISEDELKNRADTAAAAGVIAYLYRTYGMDDELMEMLELYPEFQEDPESGILRKYMDEPLLSQAEREACELLSAQVRYLSEFNAYYSTIKKNAERLQHTSIFGDPTSFAYRNTIKTVRDFEAIDGARGALGDDRAVTSVFDDPIADYLMLLFMAACCVIMLKERRTGLWQLVRSTKHGRARLAGSRIVILFICSLLATVFIFGSRLAISYITYDGFGWGSRIIQSIRGYNGIPFPLQVNSFVLIYCGIKLVCTFLTGVLLYLLLSSIKNVNIAIAFTGAVLAMEFTLYSAVRDNSILVPFKYINIFQLIVPRGFVVNYLNLNVFEHPLNTRVAVAIVMTVLSALAAVGVVLVHLYKRPVGKPNPIEKLLDWIRKRTYRLVWMQETGKALFAERGIFVIAVLVFLFFSFVKLPEPTVSEDQRAVATYYKKYAGFVSEATLAAIDLDMENVRREIANSEDSFMAMMGQKTLLGLEYLKQDVADIIERNVSGEYPREIKLLPPFTYMTVFGSGSREFETGQGLKALLCIALFTAGLYAYERQSSMSKLLRAFPKGRTRLFLKKELLTFVFSVLVFAAVYLPEILALAKNDLYGGFTCFGFPVQGLEFMRESRLSLSVGILTVCFYAARLLAIFLVGSAAGLLSNLSDRVNNAFVINAAVLVVPACVASMGVSQLFDFTLLTILWGSGAYFYSEWLPFAVHAALLLAMTVINFVITCLPRGRKKAYISCPGII